MFILDAQLTKDTHFIKTLDLCDLLLMDNSSYPWIILVPKRESVSEVIELSSSDRACLMQEICYISEIIKEIYNPYKLNIGAIGNIVRQLHIHIIAREQNDPSWPGPVWGDKSPRKFYDEDGKNLAIKKIINQLDKN